MRKLVTIRTVSEVNPIPDADTIECLTVEGWKVVSQKGNFKPGDPCVYFEIDSFLPDGNPLWQDLVDKSSREYEGRKGHVLRTIKLRGQVSQGFCIPLHEFPEIMDELLQKYHDGVYFTRIWEQVETANPRFIATDAFTRYRDRDWADVLGVVKYEPPIPAELAGLVKGSFPSFIKKTDQERCQNLATEIFVDNAGARYEVTTKLDGSSCTVYRFNGELGVCSRNLELKICDENKDNTLVRILFDNLFNISLEQGRNIAVQGEVMGPGIQGNREQLKKPEFYIFDIFDIDRGEYVSPAERHALVEQFCTFWPQIKHVPRRLS
jgi:hypothetical protein